MVTISSITDGYQVDGKKPWGRAQPTYMYYTDQIRTTLEMKLHAAKDNSSW